MSSVDFSYDFAKHSQVAVSEYLLKQPFFEKLASVVASIIEECLNARDIKVHSVQYRAKDPTSFGRKVATPSDKDPGVPKYPEPLDQITDLSGVRIITHFPGTLADIDTLIDSEFCVVERSDKSDELVESEKFGYRSVHYLIKIREERIRLAEYQRFKNSIVELQVRTILQHTWAEIEHDIQYKSTTLIPTEIKRRFMALAGMLEIADREFQAIQDADRAIDVHAQDMVEKGSLQGVEITANSLKSFLDKRLGPDGRISEWTYDWTARLLKKLGFSDLEEIERAISPYNDDHLSVIAWGGRQGQTARFELMLLAALEQRFIERHIYAEHDWFKSRQAGLLERFKGKGIPLNTFSPRPHAG